MGTFCIAVVDGENSDTISARQEWIRRHENIQSLVNQLTKFYRRLVIDSPNKSLVQEIFPYIWEAQGVLNVISAVIDWMRRGCLPSATSDSIKWWKNGEFDMEPWTLAGGLLTDLQKLVVISQNVAVFFAKCAIPLNLKCYSIRVWHEGGADLAELLYENFASKEDKILCKSIFPKDPSQFYYDKYFGIFIEYGKLSCHHLICEELGDEENKQIFAVLTVVEDIRRYLDSYKEVYLPSLIDKYRSLFTAEESKNDGENDMVQLVIDEIRKWPLNDNLSNDLFVKLPTMTGIYWQCGSNDAVPVRRILQVLVATLGLRGSPGFFSAVPTGERVSLLSKLGLETFDEFEISDYSIMGHSL